MLNTKKMELSKKDMNFFSEFSSSSRQVNSYMSLILIVFISLLVFGAALYLVLILQSAAVRNDIDKVTNSMNNQNFSDAEFKYNANTADIQNLNQKYFDLTSLFSRVSNMSKVESQYMDTIQKNLPADVVITDFTYEKGAINLKGICNSLYSPLDFIARLDDTKMFTYVDISDISKVDISVTDPATQAQANLLPYSFTLTGSLEASYPVTLTRVVDAVQAVPLSALESKDLAVGSTYTITAINSYTASDGRIYTLSNVIVNQIALSATNLAVLQQGGSYDIRVTSSIDVKLLYKLSASNGGVQ